MAGTPSEGRRKTRSGMEYSPFATAIALHIPGVRLTQLLRRRDEGPDSDTDSLNESDDGLDDELEAEPQPHAPRPSATPATAPPPPPPPNNVHPRSVIRIARAPPPLKKTTKATLEQVKARRLLKKHAKDRAARSVDRERCRINAGSRLKGITRLRLRQTAPALQLNLNLGDYVAPVAASGWQAVRQTETDTRHTPVIDADHHILLVLGGEPPNEAAWSSVATDAADQLQAAAIEIYTEPKWRRKAGLGEDVPRRGSHAAKHAGAAMGGRQRYPAEPRARRTEPRHIRRPLWAQVPPTHRRLDEPLSYGNFDYHKT
ncbi:hypothetical protein C8F04DRAFT_1271406 [Mycena alexandri]|uniref:Uncharacterized protein n=1 Tax=Mycena alexandri TaxID=1745969 RepID=A0AAD6S8T4_9AGAR|nr:hypothetical protein C8F04DRAFT_1271406 [Mycena alexandri]